MLVDAYNKENEKRAAAGKPVGLNTAGGRPPKPAGTPAQADGATYIGNTACGACHAPALAQWKTTKHARALAALAKVGRDRDPSCVGCHVTGYLQAGGPRDIADARERFANVGCESCHGPGSKHGAAADKRGTLARAVPEATCRGCHTPDVTNGEFDYKKFIPAITGPGHMLRAGW
jgi:hypothetical protein